MHSIFAPKTGALYPAPKIGAMTSKIFRASIHSAEHQALRKLWVSKRKQLGLSQRELAEKLGVTRSLVGKIETGDRRLDVIEAINYAASLNINTADFIGLLESFIES